MAIRVYGVPKEIGEPPFYDPGKDWRENIKIEERWLDRVIRWCKTNGQGRYRGRIAAFPAGDGCARYVVFAPGKLIWLPVGDRWQYPHIERLTMKDVTLYLGDR